jgi:hypothetical protein
MQRKRFLGCCCLLHPRATQFLQGPINAGRVRVFVEAWIIFILLSVISVSFSVSVIIDYVLRNSLFAMFILKLLIFP